MGSFAELSVHNGIMERLTIPGGGTYDLQGQQRTPLVSPWPLKLLSAKWQFQDANWFPDFQTSARQMIQFYKDAGGMEMDGVIAINATFVIDLLQLLGPIDMPDYGRIIDQTNFLTETQKIVETEYDRVENKPKAFIGDLAPKLIEKALHGTPTTFLDLAERLNDGLSKKDIQLYFENESEEKSVLAHGWGGEIKSTDKDYLMIVNTNLGGGKTDGVIEEHVNMHVLVDDSGMITNTITIARTHHGHEGDLITGVNNVNFLRLYIPKGSRLIKASGFNLPDAALFETPEPDWGVDQDLQYADDGFSLHEQSGTQIYEENGKTVFGNWTQTKPGETTITTFTYTLPFTLSNLLSKQATIKKIRSVLGMRETETYSLLIQKQSGVSKRTTEVNIQFPKSLQTVWSSHPLSHTSFSNETDGFLGALFERAL